MLVARGHGHIYQANPGDPLALKDTKYTEDHLGLEDPQSRGSSEQGIP